MSLDIAPDIRDALLAEPTIAGLLTDWHSEAAIFTRIPIPEDAAYPYIVISPDIALTDADGLESDRPVVIRDIRIYGQQPDDYRIIEQLGYLIRDLFHRDRFSIIKTGFDIILITASGPSEAPSSDEETVGRLVTLTINMRKTP